MIREAIILAGGLGTRLRGVIKEIPKPMAPVAEKPFLAYLIERLGKYKIDHIVLAVGYKYEVVQEYFGTSYAGVSLSYSIEKEPLGTGGAIKLATTFLNEDYCIVVNGDTLFDIDYTAFGQQHLSSNVDMTIALRAVKNADRYGKVVVANEKIVSFKEKGYIESGYINGGIYGFKKSIFNKLELINKFSFENDVLEKEVENLEMIAFPSDAYFIDIGIPEDYERSQEEIPHLINSK